MSKKLLFFISFFAQVVIVLFAADSVFASHELERSFVRLDGGLVPASSCNQSVTDSRVFDDNSYAFLYSVSFGGFVTHDDDFAVHSYIEDGASPGGRTYTEQRYGNCSC